MSMRYLTIVQPQTQQEFNPNTGKSTAASGDYVLATDPTSNAPTFKHLVNDAGRWFLRPINAAYPTTEITDPAKQVIGRVIEYQLRRKL